MSETIIDSATLSSGGGFESGTLGKSRDSDEAILVVDGDSNSSNLDVTATGAAPQSSGTVAKLVGGDSVTGIDATTDANNRAVVRLTGLSGLGQARIKITNQATSSTTITVSNPDH